VSEHQRLTLTAPHSVVREPLRGSGLLDPRNVLKYTTSEPTHATQVVQLATACQNVTTISSSCQLRLPPLFLKGSSGRRRICTRSPCSISPPFAVQVCLCCEAAGVPTYLAATFIAEPPTQFRNSVPLLLQLPSVLPRCRGLFFSPSPSLSLTQTRTTRRARGKLR